MNKIFTLIALLIFFTNSVILPIENNPRKYALIIAIADYPEGTGWMDISSDKDVGLIKGMLEKQQFNDIDVISDAAATKEGILNAVNRLKSKLKKGDIALIHFSSHGQQIFDDNSDEPDDLDEAIAAYGAPSRYYQDYKGEKHLRDDEIGKMLEDLRVKTGSSGEVIVFIDACHSGSGTRGSDKVRGGMEPLVPYGFNFQKDDTGSGNYEVPSASRGNQSSMAPLIVFSAARSNELNYEYNGFGSLSFAISKVFTINSMDISYRGIFSKILSVMNTIAPNQNPVLEGDGIDRTIFGGNSVPQENFYTIKEIAGDEVILNCGSFNGIYKGSVIGFYPAGTRNPKEKETLFTAAVTYSDNFTSTVVIDKPLDQNKNDLWAFARELSFPENSLQVSAGKTSKEFRSALYKYLGELSYVTITEDRSQNKSGIVINESDGIVNIVYAGSGVLFRDKINTGNKNFDKIDIALREFLQARSVKDIALSDPEINVEIELLPVKTKKTGNKTVITDTMDVNQKMNNGIVEFKEGESAIIRVINRGQEAAYFNIIDIQPDGVINPLIPNPEMNEDGSAYLIEPGDSYIVPGRIITFYPPFGTEMFKVFATREPINFNPVIASRGSSGEGNNQLEKLFRKNMDVTSRGAKVGTVPESSGNTHEFVFRIVK